MHAERHTHKQADNSTSCVYDLSDQNHLKRAKSEPGGIWAAGQRWETNNSPDVSSVLLRRLLMVFLFFGSLWHCWLSAGVFHSRWGLEIPCWDHFTDVWVPAFQCCRVFYVQSGNQLVILWLIVLSVGGGRVIWENNSTVCLATTPVCLSSVVMVEGILKCQCR